jgi:hypothetical protein
LCLLFLIELIYKLGDKSRRAKDIAAVKHKLFNAALQRGFFGEIGNRAPLITGENVAKTTAPCALNGEFQETVNE